ncbi:MAG: M1 family aminopeptidase [Undibacterium curvum]|uniref:ABC transporter permease/M1 family aminopeptidase n=1 Tax=Undibacterium curvum TaxID=2762294 RepID=UPI003BCAEAD5
MFTILQFELRQKFRSISTYIYFLMFFALAMLWVAASGGAFSGATISFGGKTYINAPSSVSQTITFLGYLGTVIVAAMMGRAIQQDTEHNIWHFFYTLPLHRFSYLAGRYLAALITLLFVFSSIALGAWLGLYLPGIEPVRVGPGFALAYILPYFFSIIPNLITFGAIFFFLGAIFRRMLPVYVASVVLLIGYLIAGALLSDMDNRNLAAMIDPFGSRAISRLTEYWSVDDKNTRLIPLAGIYLANRLLWGSIGLITLALCFWRFQFSAASVTGKQKKEALTAAPASLRVPRVQPDFGKAHLWHLFRAQTWLNLRETVKNVYFITIALCGVLFMFATSTAITKMYGTATYPVTYAVLQVMSGSFALFMLIITTFYAGELVWREREARIAQLMDALPVPNALPFLSKLSALILLQGILLAVLMVCGILVQLFHGYTRFELGQYLYQLFLLQWPDYMLLAVLAMSLQVIVNNKYVAYFLMILYYIASIALPALGVEHPMVIYGNTPGVTYSALNGYGHFIPAIRWTQAYWGGAALMLIAASLCFWVRGTGSDWRGRLHTARAQLSGSTLGLGSMGALLFLLCGGVLFYFYNIVNSYKTSYDNEVAQANYEKKYKALEGKPQPRISDVKLAVDIFPDRRSTAIEGEYQLVNRSAEAISEIYILQNDEAEIRQLTLESPNTVGIRDKDMGMYSFRLQPALAPGASVRLRFRLNYDANSFLGMSKRDTVIANGTFFNSSLMPQIGYQSNVELSEDKIRRKHGLKEKERMLQRDDPRGLANSYISNDADWIRFDATVSTSSDQMAIAPGKLDKSWEKDGRRYFHYSVDQPILNFYSFQSGRYAVKQAQWNDVAIEIDYQPGHEYNLDRMVKGVQQSLTYYSKNFSPYQHKLVRIIEFPRYSSFAQAFPNTIPFSESIGFIAKVDDNNPKDIDYPFYVTAHEVAHQWWAHQVISANTQGATTLVETLAQYSALMVMKQTYGEAKMRKFLKYELDAYLRGRGQERKKEQPLAFNENQQYIHYNKGSLIMYLMQDQLGEEQVNRALREVVAQYANRGAPYPTSRVLVDALRRVAPADKQEMITDAFESIILYESRALSATAKAIGAGQYEITLKVSNAKLKADEFGAEKEVALNDSMDIGVDDKDGKPLLRERHLIRQKSGEYKLIVSGKPAKAGIDPDNKYIDRKPDDNLIQIEFQDATK